MPEVSPNWKPEKVKRSKGRARPDEPMADYCRFPAGCSFSATERHHVVLRSQGGGDDETVDLCLIHHRWVHGNVAAATELGLIKRRSA